ncbi:hypothetical protein C6A85_15805, partial [Mycobacterium sp. ITM-2017-0098]
MWLTIWATSLVLSQVLGFVRAWVDAQVDWKLLAEIRQRDHQDDRIDSWRNDAVSQEFLHTAGLDLNPLHQRAAACAGE